MQGNKIRGTFAYDDAAVGTYPVSWMGFYEFVAPLMMSAKVGPHNLSTGGLHITVMNDTGSNLEDVLDVTGLGLVLDGTTYASGYFGFRLATGPGPSQALTGTGLPAVIRLEDFVPGNSYGYVMVDGSASGQVLQFTIDSLEPAKKP